MKKHKLSKSDEQWLRAEAKKLPADYSVTGIKREISGANAVKTGLKKTNSGEAIDKNATYVTKIPNLTPMNHTRRLIKAYEAGGWESVNKYLDRYRTPEDKLLPVVEKPKQPEQPKKQSIMQKIRNIFN